MASEPTSKPNETARAGDLSNLAQLLAFVGSQFESTSTTGTGEASPEFDADSEARQGIPGIPGEDFLRDMLGSSLSGGQRGSKPPTPSPKKAEDDSAK